MPDLNQTYMDQEFEDFAEEMSCNNIIAFPYRERCDFVKKTPACNEEVQFLTYMSLMSCTFHVRNKFQECVFISFCISLCFFLLVMLAHCADMYFSTALKVISKYLHMNEHLAGVTILAFGNTSPDVFANLAELKGSKSVFANSMATCIFISMLTGGLVCFLCPFRMNSHATVRDILFLMLGTILMEYLLFTDGKIDVWECIVMAVLYIVYVAVNIADLYLMRHSITHLEKEIDEIRTRSNTYENIQKIRLLLHKLNELKNDNEINILEKSERGSVVYNMDGQSRRSIDYNYTRQADFNEGNPKNLNLYREFFTALNPIDMEHWHRTGLFMRGFQLVKAPAVLICALICPLVDFEERKHGWCKLLNCLHIIINPIVVVEFGMGLLNRDANSSFIHFEYMYIVYLLPVCLPLALLVFFHSRTDVPPPYHCVFTFISVFGSMFILYACATEIDKIFDLIGMTLDISENFMGVSVNCACGALGDLVTNAAMALQGYEKMAYAATMGGPFFNLLIGAGVVFIGRNVLELPTEYETQNGLYGHNAFVILMLGLSTTLLWTAMLNFRARRSMGIFNMSLYFIFLAYNVLGENAIIHTYADDPKFLVN